MLYEFFNGGDPVRIFAALLLISAALLPGLLLTWAAPKPGGKRGQRTAVSGDAEAHIARIDALTANGRTNWFGLMAYLAFTLVTVLAVRDVDFFDASRDTQLPLIGVAIPTFSFFIFAPLLGAAFYVYLHLTVRKATEALCAAPHQVGGAPLETCIKPWLLNDMVLRGRGLDADGKPAATPRPLDAFATISALSLIWLAGPALLALMWWRSWPAHEPELSLAIAACLLITLYVGLTSWTRLQADLAGDDNSFGALLRDVGLSVGAMLLLITTLQQTSIGIPQADGSVRLASADLAGARLSVLPPDQVDRTAARHRFRAEWCKRHGMTPEVCDRAPTPGHTAFPALADRRESWCRLRGIMPDDCGTIFKDLESEFDREWTTLRAQTLAALPKPDLSGRDLRNADLSGASLANVVLRGARLDAADLRNAQLEGAILTCDPLTVAQALSREGLETDEQKCLTDAASLIGARLQNANLVSADFRFAQMEGADLSGARMEGAELRWARIKSAEWAGATIGASPAHWADLRGGRGLSQSGLSSLLGDASTLLPETLANGSVPFVCTCWSSDPPKLEKLIARFERYDITKEELRNREWFCPGGTPMKTGTPWPVDAAPPWGAQRENEDDSDYSNRISDWTDQQPTPTEPCPPAPWGTGAE